MRLWITPATTNPLFSSNRTCVLYLPVSVPVRVRGHSASLQRETGERRDNTVVQIDDGSRGPDALPASQRRKELPQRAPQKIQLCRACGAGTRTG